MQFTLSKSSCSSKSFEEPPWSCHSENIDHVQVQNSYWPANALRQRVWSYFHSPPHSWKKVIHRIPLILLTDITSTAKHLSKRNGWEIWAGTHCIVGSTKIEANLICPKLLWGFEHLPAVLINHMQLFFLGPKKVKCFSGLWFQPLWKILVKMGSSSPIFGVKITNLWNHHPVLLFLDKRAIQKRLPWEPVVWLGLIIRSPRLR